MKNVLFIDLACTSSLQCYHILPANISCIASYHSNGTHNSSQSVSIPSIGQNMADLWQKNIEIVGIPFAATILDAILNIKNCSRVTPLHHPRSHYIYTPRMNNQEREKLYQRLGLGGNMAFGCRTNTNTLTTAKIKDGHEM